MTNVQTMQLYCVSDATYYETPERLADASSRFARATGAAPPGWIRSGRGLWAELRPAGAVLPGQGWKIHLSATPETAAQTLDIAAEICLRHRASFKFLRSERALRFATGKYMPRAGSGKFVTIYPADERQLGALLRELTEALDGRPGPYILGDLRIGRGPVFVRYGAFVEQWCAGSDGTPVRAIRDPSGVLVPDERRPLFDIPSWVRPPDELRPHLAARAVPATPDFPYRVLRALHFTNAGGIYLAEHLETGQQVVLREARPHSGLDEAGSDAVTRLRREYDTLTKLAGLDCVPRVYALTTVWEHEFLVEEYVEGLSLLEAVVFRHPLRFVDPSDESIATYLQWVDTITTGLSGALDSLHARGVSFGDLHPGNVIVRPDDSVMLVDFEYAGAADASGGPRIGAQGFTAPPEATGAEADRYSLRSTWLMMLMPVMELADHDPEKIRTLETLARRRFGFGPDDGPPLPEPRAGKALRRPSGESVVVELFDQPAKHWPVIRDQLVAGILDAATPDRTDRLFPADPAVFDERGAAVAHGAAGVLMALHRAGAAVPAGHVDWLATAAARTPVRVGRGLFDGLHGVAAVLDELGRRDEALEVLSRCRDVSPTTAGLFSGRAGIALVRCRFAASTGDGAFLDEAVRDADRLDALIRDGADGTLALPSTAGLSHGMTGAALLQLRLYRVTGEERFLRAARRALSHELGHCVSMQDGTVQVRIGNRHLLYLAEGSGGIALVAQEYLTHREDPELSSFVRAVRRGCGHEHVREPGLFQGRAGLLAVLGQLAGPDAGDEVMAQARRFAWYAVHRDGSLLIPGARLRRFSADLATGSAGVLLALHSALNGDGDVLSSLLPG